MEPLATENEAERLRVITEAIEQIRPHLVADGGDIELASIEGHIVKVKLKGACVGCGAMNATLGGLRRMISSALGGGPVLVQPVL